MTGTSDNTGIVERANAAPPIEPELTTMANRLDTFVRKLGRGATRLGACGLLGATAVACSCGTGTGAAPAPDVHPAPVQAGAATTPDAPPPVRVVTRALAAAASGFVESRVRAGTAPPRLPPVRAERVADAVSAVEEVLGWNSLEDATTAILVADAETGAIVWERNADQLLKPASNTKLFTTAAALELLGADTRFATRLVHTGTLEDGVVSGDLIVVGNHDFTWSERFYDAPDAPLRDLARQARAAGIENVEGDIVASGEFLLDGFRYDTYHAQRNRYDVAKALRGALLSEGITANGSRVTRPDLEPPEGAVAVGRFESVPLGVAIAPINRISHNEFADSLMRHIGYRMRGESSYAAGADAVREWLGSIGVDVEGFVLHDGSGLSHDNRVTARQLVALVRHMASVDAAEAFERSLSVAGEFGTYAGRMRGPDTRGRVFVKSGTLNGVITTSGFLRNQHDGRTYALAVLMNEVEGRKSPRLAQNRIVEAFAGDLRGIGSRPEAPVLHRVASAGDGHAAEISWSEVEGAVGYWIWTRSAARAWTRERFVEGPRTRLYDRATGDVVRVRVTAVDPDGGESDPSDAYATRVAASPANVLIVDGNDRWQSGECEENTWRGPHAFATIYADSLGGVTFDTAADDALRAGLVSLDDYRAAFWSAGEEGGESPGLAPDERHAIEAFLGRGGKLFISGSELAFDLSADLETRAFCRECLRATSTRDDARTTFAEGSGGIFAHIGRIGFFTPGGMEVDTPDVLDPENGAIEAMRYANGRGAAAVQYAGDYKLVQLGFPFEAIDSGDDRAAVLAAVLEFFEL